jgi:hypothetical protein
VEFSSKGECELGVGARRSVRRVTPSAAASLGSSTVPSPTFLPMPILLVLALQDVAPVAPPPRLAPMFGAWLRPAGDVDADRVPDFVVGDDGWTPNGTPAAFWVLSGKTGAEIASFHAEDGAAGFPSAIDRAGDLDQDGHADLWLRFEGGGVQLWSGTSCRTAASNCSSERKSRACNARKVGGSSDTATSRRSGITLVAARSTATQSEASDSREHTTTIQRALASAASSCGANGPAWRCSGAKK